MLNSSIPIDKFDSKKISIINKDSVIQTFESKMVNEVDLILDFEILPNDKYLIEILPKGIIDFFGNTTDTLNYYLQQKDLTTLKYLSIYQIYHLNRL